MNYVNHVNPLCYMIYDTASISPANVYFSGYD